MDCSNCSHPKDEHADGTGECSHSDCECESFDESETAENDLEEQP